MSRRPVQDEGLEQIAQLEAGIVKAFEEKHAFHGTAAAEVAALRPGVVTLAANIAAGLRAEYLGRSRQL